MPEWLKQIEQVLDLLEVMEEWSLAARRSREVVWRMYEASRAVQAQGAAARSQSPAGLHITTTADSIVVGGGEVHMSPIGLEPVDGMGGMMGLLDQGGLWDLDGMYWGGNGPQSPTNTGNPDDSAAAAEFAAYAAAQQAASAAHHHPELMQHVDYGMMHHHHAGHHHVGMEGFGYVQ